MVFFLEFAFALFTVNLIVTTLYAFFSRSINQEINQLTRIFALCGTPDNELTEKIISEEVSRRLDGD